MSTVEQEVIGSGDILEEVQDDGSLSFDYEEEARLQGWVEKEDFRGDPVSWVDAETFVKKGREINPILRANNEQLKRSISNLERQNSNLIRELSDLRKQQVAINKRDFTTTVNEIKSLRMQALRAGDEEKFLQLDNRLDTLLNKRRELIGEEDVSTGEGNSPPQENYDPEFMAWVEDNNWYGRDEFRTTAVNHVAEVMRERYPNLTGRKFLDAVLRESKRRYPEDFGVRTTSSRNVIGDFGNPTTIVRHGNGRSERDLPEDARKAMSQFVEDKLGTKEQYLKLYFNEE